ncbi:MAG TPA: type II secretion system protein, partial [Candidatus Hydrogenedentes bacterium]|nr:type II secretion system protein [Candidatus Hydrogenedentota bacterium]
MNRRKATKRMFLRADQGRRVRVCGFTLLELLIAVSVLTVIVGLVHATFASITSSMALARDNADRLRFKQIVWRNLSTNLQGVYADAGCVQPEYQFLGKSADGPHGAADNLRFATSLPLPGTRSLPGVSKIVTYELV